ncbi:RNA polymerase sigma factor [Dactylosporangium sp. NPDC000521]|uniref:RNA polymerase sigma factor n=1 Tax=Dactylosporangium sp. NPDC000521 TaxID=3363975 RepID=UPI0036CF7069
MMATTVDDETDPELLRRCAEGDEQAFRTLTRRYNLELRSYCRRFSRDPHDAQDLLQEVLIKAWRHCASFDGRSSVRTWLYRIVVNTSIDNHRRSLRRPVPVADPACEMPSPSPESEVIDREELRAALRQVPEHYRTVVILSDGLGWPYNEIAALCGIPEATVRSRLSRGRRTLRTLLSARPD